MGGGFFAIFVNGDTSGTGLVTSSKQRVVQATGGATVHVSSDCIVTLAANDLITARPQPTNNVTIFMLGYSITVEKIV